METLKSNLDKSVNFVEGQLAGFIESRYVRRNDKYFNCYLSSQSGCNKGCRFCHLTATHQTTFEDVDRLGFWTQATQVFQHYKAENQPAKHVHYSFMARGEPLDNKHLLANADSILMPLAELAVREGLAPKFNISTIMPRTLSKPLADIFKIITPTIYYSMYSVRNEFRQKWVPMAMPVNEALQQLKDYQSVTKKLVKIHFAFIKGQNDSHDDVRMLCDAIDNCGLSYEFNLVRYNPFSAVQGVESDEDTIWKNFHYINDRSGGKAKIIQRVGFDVYASCGLFVSK